MFSSAFLFFFSSRRRHTRLVSDWSSDVCSSDLRWPRLSVPTNKPTPYPVGAPAVVCCEVKSSSRVPALRNPGSSRSEERRVGKECRSRWSPYEQKKKRREKEIRRQVHSNIDNQV